MSEDSKTPLEPQTPLESPAPVEQADGAPPAEATPTAEPEAPVEAKADPKPAAPNDAQAPSEAEAPSEAKTDGESDAPAKAKPDTPAEPTAEDATKAPPPNPALYRAMRAKRPVKGKVDAVIKGGFEIKIPKARGFCPASQIAVEKVADPESLVGQTLEFRVIQIRSGGKDVVLSRRALLEAGRIEEAKAVRATLIDGAVTQGRVVGLADFGAFVDLGAGVRGLVHLSELSHARVEKASDAVKEGDAVQVKILKIDNKRDRISLSIKQAQVDPWKKATETYAEGTEVEGTVKRLADFGMFIELEPGIEALAPASEFPPERLGWQAAYEPGQTGKWKVLSVQAKRRRIALRPIGPDGAAEEPVVEAGAQFTGRVQRVEKFGVFVWLGPGKVGLMPNIWTGAPRGTDIASRYPVGEEVEVQVVEVEEDANRIRLARKGLDTNAIQAPKREKRVRDDDPASKARRPHRTEGGPVSDGAKGSFGASLADKLKAALDSGKSG